MQGVGGCSFNKNSEEVTFEPLVRVGSPERGAAKQRPSGKAREAGEEWREVRDKAK